MSTDDTTLLAGGRRDRRAAIEPTVEGGGAPGDGDGGESESEAPGGASPPSQSG